MIKHFFLAIRCIFNIIHSSIKFHLFFAIFSFFDQRRIFIPNIDLVLYGEKNTKKNVNHSSDPLEEINAHKKSLCYITYLMYICFEFYSRNSSECVSQCLMYCVALKPSANKGKIKSETRLLSYYFTAIFFQ